MKPTENVTFGDVPMLGAAYYPEDWDESEQEKDILLMVEAGLKVVRIAEFAWHKMESKEGEFEFSWLHSVVDKLKNAGIAVILGTPSATPPLWVEEKDPNMRKLTVNLQRVQHGGRRHCCSNNPTYRKYSAIIAEKMAMEFGGEEAIVGWQIDNEINAEGKGCYCDECQKGFKNYLKTRYGTIENLNKEWNHNIFSQAYDDFADIPAPRLGWHNPHLEYEWLKFQTESHIDFIHMQADIVRKYSKAPIGTDMMPIFTEDYEKMLEKLDVAQFNHYNSESDLWCTQMWYDLIRPLKDRPFWNTETSANWNGSTCTPENIRDEGFCTANSWLPIVLGGESNLYWLWRQHWAGHELMHGSVLYASGRPMHTFGEVKGISAGYAKCADFLKNTKVYADTAFMASADNSKIMTFQSVMPDNVSGSDLYKMRLYRMYHQVTKYGIRPDVIGVTKPLDNYKLLITPFMMTLELGNLQERITEFVKNGGVWVCGPLTDVRNKIGAHYTDRATGILESLTGAQMTDQIPDKAHKTSVKWADGSEFSANNWLQLFEIPKNAEPIATVDGGYSTLVGKSVVFKVKVGKGTVIILGTVPGEEDMEKILDMAVNLSGADRFKINGNLTVARRYGKYDGFATVEHSGNSAELKLDGSYTDIISSKTYKDFAKFDPFQVMILKRN